MMAVVRGGEVPVLTYVVVVRQQANRCVGDHAITTARLGRKLYHITLFSRVVDLTAEMISSPCLETRSF